MRSDGLQLTEIYWGLWLIPLAILVYRSGFLPRLIAFFISMAALGYVLDWSLTLLRPEVSYPFHHLFSFELALPRDYYVDV